MNHLEKEIKNSDGTIDTLILTSNDNYKINLTNKYKLANHNIRKENKLVSMFKNSILGSEIGVKAEGFSNIAILATIVAIGALCTMYVFWRI